MNIEKFLTHRLIYDSTTKLNINKDLNLIRGISIESLDKLVIEVLDTSFFLVNPELYFLLDKEVIITNSVFILNTTASKKVNYLDTSYLKLKEDSKNIYLNFSLNWVKVKNDYSKGLILNLNPEILIQYIDFQWNIDKGIKVFEVNLIEKSHKRLFIDSLSSKNSEIKYLKYLENEVLNGFISNRDVEVSIKTTNQNKINEKNLLSISTGKFNIFNEVIYITKPFLKEISKEDTFPIFINENGDILTSTFSPNLYSFIYTKDNSLILNKKGGNVIIDNKLVSETLNKLYLIGKVSNLTLDLYYDFDISSEDISLLNKRLNELKSKKQNVLDRTNSGIPELSLYNFIFLFSHHGDFTHPNYKSNNSKQLITNVINTNNKQLLLDYRFVNYFSSILNYSNIYPKYISNNYTLDKVNLIKSGTSGTGTNGTTESGSVINQEIINREIVSSDSFKYFIKCFRLIDKVVIFISSLNKEIKIKDLYFHSVVNSVSTSNNTSSTSNSTSTITNSINSRKINNLIIRKGFLNLNSDSTLKEVTSSSNQIWLEILLENNYQSEFNEIEFLITLFDENSQKELSYKTNFNSVFLFNSENYQKFSLNLNNNIVPITIPVSTSNSALSSSFSSINYLIKKIHIEPIEKLDLNKTKVLIRINKNGSLSNLPTTSVTSNSSLSFFPSFSFIDASIYIENNLLTIELEDFIESNFINSILFISNQEILSITLNSLSYLNTSNLIKSYTLIDYDLNYDLDNLSKYDYVINKKDENYILDIKDYYKDFSILNIDLLNTYSSNGELVWISKEIDIKQNVIFTKLEIELKVNNDYNYDFWNQDLKVYISFNEMQTWQKLDLKSLNNYLILYSVNLDYNKVAYQLANSNFIDISLNHFNVKIESKEKLVEIEYLSIRID